MRLPASITYPSVPASEPWTQPSDSQFQRVAACCSWRGKCLPWRALRRAWQKAHWTTPVFGETSALWTQPLSVAEYARLWVDCPVSPQAPPANEEANPISAGSGMRETASSASASRSTFSGKMCPVWSLVSCSLPSATESLGHWKKWVTGARRESSRRRKSGLRTKESGFSSWPTVRAQEDGCSVETTLARKARAKEKHEAGEYADGCGAPSMNSLNFAVQLWPTISVGDSESGQTTPSFNEGRGGMDNRLRVVAAQQTNLWQTPDTPNGGGKTRGGDRKDELLLEGQAPAVTDQLWMTPTGNPEAPNLGSHKTGPASIVAQAEAMWQTATVQDAGGRDYTYSNGNHDKPFLTLTGQAQAESWATPTTRYHKDGADPSPEAPTNGLLGRQAPRAMEGEMWSTPTAKCSEDSQTHRSGDRSGELLLTGQAAVFLSFLPVPATSTAGGEFSEPTSTLPPPSAGTKRRLSPEFVGWLMGMPPGWLSLNHPPASISSALQGTPLLQFKQGWLCERCSEPSTSLTQSQSHNSKACSTSEAFAAWQSRMRAELDRLLTAAGIDTEVQL